MDVSPLLDRLISTRVDIPGTSNTRDLGGYPTRGGRVIRAGALYRGEALTYPGPHAHRVAVWRDDALESYRALALATVIDLRGAEEAALAPSAWAAPTHANLVLIPIEEGGEGDATAFMRGLRDGTLRSFSSADLAAYYFRTVRGNAPQLGDALRTVARAGATPVLIHCAAGKDRTGLLVAMLLEAIGVPREVVVADYAMTSVFRPNRVAAYAGMLAASGIDPQDVSALFEAPPDAMSILLDGLDQEYGSVRGFLADRAGLDDDIVGALETALLTQVNSPAR